MSLHHKSREEEEGGMTSPSRSREHKGDKTVGDKPSCCGNFPSLAFLKVSSVSPANQATFCLTPPVHAYSPAQSDPVLPVLAQPPLGSGTPGPMQCTSKAPSLLFLFHVLAQSTFDAFPHARQPLLHLLVFCLSTVQGLSLGRNLGCLCLGLDMSLSTCFSLEGGSYLGEGLG